MAAESKTGVFNTGSGEAVRINGLAGVIINLCGKNPVAVHIEPRDIRHSQARVERARGIGFVPEYRLEEGLKKTIWA